MGLQMELLAPSPSLKLMARLLVEEDSAAGRWISEASKPHRPFFFSLVPRQQWAAM